jgi:hypothetical protein
MTAQPVAVWAVASSILLLLSSTALVLRAVAAQFRGGSFKMHDYLVILAYLCHIAYVVDDSALGICSSFCDGVFEPPFANTKR